MTGLELIQFIQENHLENYEFSGNFADDHPCILPISNYTININRENNTVLFEAN